MNEQDIETSTAEALASALAQVDDHDQVAALHEAARARMQAALEAGDHEAYAALQEKADAIVHRLLALEPREPVDDTPLLIAGRNWPPKDGA